MMETPVYTVCAPCGSTPSVARVLTDRGYASGGPFADSVTAHAWAVEQYGAAYLPPPAFALCLARAAYVSDVLHVMSLIGGQVYHA